ncbi:hypothetical protein [Komagataeibacter europaeus]|uniref:hypothetical protein n=1 Tax=Komagataeibacter europaeus TaxID=33995 RepID=UPI0012FA8A91|nr:hypothetical protein [Komagataeibacter europaeus]
MMAVTCWVSPATESGLRARYGATVNEGRHAPVGVPFFIVRVERPFPEMRSGNAAFFQKGGAQGLLFIFNNLISDGF